MADPISEDEIIALVDPYKFDQRFWEHAQTAPTYRKAYHKTEQEFRSVFGYTKYSNYESYQTARNRRNG